MIFKRKENKINKVYVIVGMMYGHIDRAGWVSDSTVSVHETYRKAIKEIRAIEKRKQHYYNSFDLEVTMDWKSEHDTLEIKCGDTVENWVIYEKEVK
jgi:hypothetical protein